MHGLRRVGEHSGTYQETETGAPPSVLHVVSVWRGMWLDQEAPSLVTGLGPGSEFLS